MLPATAAEWRIHMESKEDKTNCPLEETVFFKRFVDLLGNPEISVIENALLKVDNDIRKTNENLKIVTIGFIIFVLISVFFYIDYGIVIIIFITLSITACIQLVLMNSRKEKKKFLLELLAEARMRDFRQLN